MNNLALNKGDIVRGHIIDQIKKRTDDEGFIIEEAADLDTTISIAGIDSLDLLEISWDLEKCYGIEIPDGSINVNMTFSELVEFVYNIIPE